MSRKTAYSRRFLHVWPHYHNKTEGDMSSHRSVWHLPALGDSAWVSLCGRSCHTLQPETKVQGLFRVMPKSDCENMSLHSSFLTWQNSIVYLDLQSSEQNSSVEPPYVAVTSFCDKVWQYTQELQCLPQLLVSSRLKRTLQPWKGKWRNSNGTDSGVLFECSLSSIALYLHISCHPPPKIHKNLSGHVTCTVMSPYHQYRRSSLCCLFFLRLWWSFLFYNFHTGMSDSWLSSTPHNISHYRQKPTCPVDRVGTLDKPSNPADSSNMTLSFL